MGAGLDIYDACHGLPIAEAQLLALREVAARAYDLTTAHIATREGVSQLSPIEWAQLVDDLAAAISSWHETGGA